VTKNRPYGPPKMEYFFLEKGQIGYEKIRKFYQRQKHNHVLATKKCTQKSYNKKPNLF
jgi:hypothetical protein